MAEQQASGSRRLMIAELTIVFGLVFFIAPLVMEPFFGPLGRIYLGLSLAGAGLCAVAALMLRRRSTEFVDYLSQGENGARTLWRQQPVRQVATVGLTLFLLAVIQFRDNLDWGADQVAAIGVIILVIAEVFERWRNLILNKPAKG